MPAHGLVGHVLAVHVAEADRRLFRSNVIRAARGAELRFSFDVIPRGMQAQHVRARVARTAEGLAWMIRKQAAAATGESFAVTQLGNVLEGMRDGVLVVDSGLRVRFANHAARAILASHELELGELMPDPWPTSLRALVTDLLEHDAYSAEALIEPDDRSAFWIRAYQSDEGQNAVILLSDVTAEERREQAERDFIANAAHELQSPLTGISTAVEVLLAGAHRNEKTRLKFLGHVAEANDRLSRLLQSLLLLAEAQSAGGRRVVWEPVDLRLAFEAVSAASDQDGARVDILCPEGLSVHAHPGLLEHALHNLVSNALRHGEGSRVIVNARPAPSGGVVIEVSDHGPGLTREQREQAFDRFYRAQARDGRGFGLGLSIVREAARTLGGDVELLPNARGGLTARLTIGTGR